MHDAVIDRMVQEVLLWRHTQIPVQTLRDWITHLRDVVQPQLDELAALKATRKTKS